MDNLQKDHNQAGSAAIGRNVRGSCATHTHLYQRIGRPL